MNYDPPSKRRLARAALGELSASDSERLAGGLIGSVRREALAAGGRGGQGASVAAYERAIHRLGWQERARLALGGQEAWRPARAAELCEALEKAGWLKADEEGGFKPTERGASLGEAWETQAALPPPDPILPPALSLFERIEAWRKERVAEADPTEPGKGPGPRGG